jgi:hypothetical protein
MVAPTTPAEEVFRTPSRLEATEPAQRAGSLIKSELLPKFSEADTANVSQRTRRDALQQTSPSCRSFCRMKESPREVSPRAFPQPTACVSGVRI